MNRWDDWRASPPKKPPPEHGIRIKKAGTTWWGQRWIEALDRVLAGDRGRLARGRSYARAGRTHDLVIASGEVTARVTGSRAEPYRVSIAMPQLSSDVWSAALQNMATKAQFSADLLDGRMPQQIDEAFLAAKASLFPTTRADLVTTCSCPDWGDPCKHVAATHYILGEALDRDPFLLFELRGRTKTQILDALRRARDNQSASRTLVDTSSSRAAGPESSQPASPLSADSLNDPPIAAIRLEALDEQAYDRPSRPLPHLHFSFDPPRTRGALLRQLGPLPKQERDLTHDLIPLISASAEAARRIAIGGATTEDAPRGTAASARSDDAARGGRGVAGRTPGTGARTRTTTGPAGSAVGDRVARAAERSTATKTERATAAEKMASAITEGTAVAARAV